MSHLSIAILRKKINPDNENSEFSYLVQFNQEGENMFFDVRDLTLGGGFRFDHLKNSIITYFELESTEKIDANNNLGIVDTNIDFEDYFPFAESQSEPFATSYLFTLSQYQVLLIDINIQSKDDPKWKFLKWVSANDLSSLAKKWKEDQKFIFQSATSFENPPFSSEMRAALRNISASLDTGKLVIFAGAGVSFDSQVPGWRDLINGLKEDLDTNESDFMKVPQAYYESRGNKEYQEKVQKVLKFGKTKFNPLHEKIVDISPLHIITTNFDDHFEQVNLEKGFKYSIVKRDSDLPYSKGESLYIKMHGDLSARNIVLKESDFKNYSNDFPLIDGYIKGIFASKLVLFVGFSFTDSNLKTITQWVSNILKTDGQKPYIVFDAITQSQKKSLEKNNELKVIEIGKTSEKEIMKYYDQIATEDDHINHNKLLGTQGKNLFRFLTVIGDYDDLNNSPKVIPMEQQLKNSVNRFMEFDAIPKGALIRLHPFKGKKDRTSVEYMRAKMEYSELETPNGDFLKYLSQSCNKSSEIIFYSYPNEKRSLAEQELDRVWKLIYRSGVRYIKRKNDTSPKRYKLVCANIDDEIQCSCSKCRLNKFQLFDLLKDLNKFSDQSICKHASMDIDLSQAFGFFNIGYVIKAFYSLDEIKNSSWNMGQFVTFYLANLNQKRLLPYIGPVNARLMDEADFKPIKQRIDRIDLDKLLLTLPVDKDVRFALKEIKENISFHSSSKIVDDCYNKVLDIYDNYKQGGYHHTGPNHGFIIAFEMFDIWNFQMENKLFWNDASAYCKLVTKYIEATLALYTISDDYSGRLNKIGSFFALALIFYADSKILIGHLKKYQVDNLLFMNHEETKKELIESFNQFITSGYTETRFSNPKAIPNQIFEIAIKNSHLFSNKTIREFNNFLILFAHIDFNKDENDLFLNQSLNYLESSKNFSFHNSHTNWAHFVTRRILDFTNESIIRIIKYLLTDSDQFDAAQTICQAIVEIRQQRSFITDIEIVYNMKNHFSPRGFRDYDHYKVLSFYPLLEIKLQEKFYEEIYEELLTLDNRIKTHAYLCEVWNPYSDPIILNHFIEELKNKGVANFLNYDFDEKGNAQDLTDYGIWNDLVYLSVWTYKFNLFEDTRIQELVNSLKSKIFIWLLSPMNFDYSQFKINWLAVFHGDSYIQKWVKSNELYFTLDKLLSDQYNEDAAKIYFKLKSLRNSSLVSQ